MGDACTLALVGGGRGLQGKPAQHATGRNPGLLGKCTSKDGQSGLLLISPNIFLSLTFLLGRPNCSGHLEIFPVSNIAINNTVLLKYVLISVQYCLFVEVWQRQGLNLFIDFS